MGCKKKILMIGPVYPYKGGISHYTSLMYRTLSKQNEMYMMSYKLQYPKLLFKKEQRDYTNDIFKIEKTDYRINTANPFNWVNVVAKIRKMKPDLVIFQWWHPYFAPCYWSICMCLKNTKVLFVCHNVFPHERFPLDKFLTRMVLKKGNYFIVQSSQDEADLLSVKANAVYKKTVHPTYNAFKLQNLAQKDGRQLLGYDEEQKLLLFFGFVREYKGLKYLLKAMPIVTVRMPDVRLMIVGDFAENKDKYMKMITDLKIENFVDIYDGYIPDREVEKYFVASNLVVLPYESATQTGIVQIAYGFAKPVIATNVGGLPEVVANNITGYIVESENDVELAHKIIDFFTFNKEEEFSAAITKEASKYSWDKMREIIDDIIEMDKSTTIHNV